MGRKYISEVGQPSAVAGSVRSNIDQVSPTSRRPRENCHSIHFTPLRGS